MGDLLPAAFEQLGANSALASRRMCIFIAFGIAAPLSCPHDVGWLGTTSGFSVIFLVYVSILVFVYALPADQTGLHACEHQDLDDDTLECFGGTTAGEGIDALQLLQVKTDQCYCYCYCSLYLLLACSYSPYSPFHSFLFAFFTSLSWYMYVLCMI